MLLTISQLAEKLGVSVVTLRRWDKDGRLKPQMRTAGGHRRYLLAEALAALGAAPPNATQEQNKRLIVAYSRVSSADQREDLGRQTQRLRDHLKDHPEALILSDLGSGLNFKKRGLCKLLQLIMAGRVAKLVITHKDRLLRFCYELVEQLVHAHGGTIEVLEDVRGTDDAELAKDVLTVITVFSARLYGRRSHQHRQAAA